MKCTKMKDLGAYLITSSPRLTKILDFDDLKCIRMKDLKTIYFRVFFTMVEENFEIRWSEITQNEGFELLITQSIFTVVEKKTLD